MCKPKANMVIGVLPGDFFIIFFLIISDKLRALIVLGATAGSAELPNV